jgi:hypothetical protein
MSDIQEYFYILVGDGPLVGSFWSEEDAKGWAAQHSFQYKWVEKVEIADYFAEKLAHTTVTVN